MTEPIRIKYQRSNQYRTVHVDGAWGGLTPEGNIHMGLFNEMRDHPEFVSFVPDAERHLREVSREGPQFMLRQIEVEAILSPNVARSLIDWLRSRLELLGQYQEQAEANAVAREGEQSR